MLRVTKSSPLSQPSTFIPQPMMFCFDLSVGVFAKFAGTTRARNPLHASRRSHHENNSALCCGGVGGLGVHGYHKKSAVVPPSGTIATASASIGMAILQVNWSGSIRDGRSATATGSTGRHKAHNYSLTLFSWRWSSLTSAHCSVTGATC